MPRGPFCFYRSRQRRHAALPFYQNDDWEHLRIRLRASACSAALLESVMRVLHRLRPYAASGLGRCVWRRLARTHSAWRHGSFPDLLASRSGVTLRRMEPAADFPLPACALTLFLKGLLEHGQALVSAMPLAENAAEAEAALREINQCAREELALDAPPFVSDAAIWGARLTYHLAQFTVCRDIGQEQIDATCNIPCPAPKSAGTIWSVDLTLRHLPRIFQLARH